MRPRVLLGIDRPGWTLDRVADQLERYLSDDFDFTRAYFAPPASLELPAWKADYQIVVAMHWPALPLMREVLTGLTDAVGVACCYDHYAFRASPAAFHAAACLADMVIVANDKMLGEMVEVAGMPPRKVRVCKDGVDTGLFKSTHLRRYQRSADPKIQFVVGWCGNSEGSGDDGKGLGIIRKMCAENEWVLHCADIKHEDEAAFNAAGWSAAVPFEKMPAWYCDLDVYVCASEHEGTPNPVLEAQACGIPVVSTDVGVAREARAIISDRDPRSLAIAVMRACGDWPADREDYPDWSHDWSWATRIEAWRATLKEVLG